MLDRGNFKGFLKHITRIKVAETANYNRMNIKHEMITFLVTFAVKKRFL